MKGRGVVDAVAQVADHVATASKRQDDPLLLVGLDLGEDERLRRARWRNASSLICRSSGPVRMTPAREPVPRGDVGGDQAVVPGDELQADAHATRSRRSRACRLGGSARTMTEEDHRAASSLWITGSALTSRQATPACASPGRSEPRMCSGRPSWRSRSASECHPACSAWRARVQHARERALGQQQVLLRGVPRTTTLSRLRTKSYGSSSGLR